jgi:hypothetical protein
MALLMIDGFDTHAAAATLADGDSHWGSQTGVAVTAAGGKFGGNSLRLAAAAVGSALLNPGTVSGNVSLAGWFKVATSTNPVPLWADTTGPLVTRNADGSIVVKDGAGTTRFTSAAGVVLDGVWTWLEVHYHGSATAGISVYSQGAALLSPYVGSFTTPGWATLKLLNSAGTGIGQIDVDDVVVWDSSGSFFNTAGVQPRRVQTLRPNAPGTLAQWAPNGATNWESVDAASWAGGAGVVGTVNGQTDRYAFSDLAATPGSVDAVVAKARVQNVGADAATLAFVAGDGVTQRALTPVAVPTVAPQVLQGVFYQDASNVTWTATTVNSAQFGQTLGV